MSHAKIGNNVTNAIRAQVASPVRIENPDQKENHDRNVSPVRIENHDKKESRALIVRTDQTSKDNNLSSKGLRTRIEISTGKSYFELWKCCWAG